MLYERNFHYFQYVHSCNEKCVRTCELDARNSVEYIIIMTYRHIVMMADISVCRVSWLQVIIITIAFSKERVKCMYNHAYGHAIAMFNFLLRAHLRLNNRDRVDVQLRLKPYHNVRFPLHFADERRNPHKTDCFPGYRKRITVMFRRGSSTALLQTPTQLQYTAVILFIFFSFSQHVRYIHCLTI